MREQKAEVAFLDYDWALNDARRDDDCPHRPCPLSIIVPVLDEARGIAGALDGAAAAARGAAPK